MQTQHVNCVWRSILASNSTTTTTTTHTHTPSPLPLSHLHEMTLNEANVTSRTEVCLQLRKPASYRKAPNLCQQTRPTVGGSRKTREGGWAREGVIAESQPSASRVWRGWKCGRVMNNECHAFSSPRFLTKQIRHTLLLSLSPVNCHNTVCKQYSDMWHILKDSWRLRNAILVVIQRSLMCDVHTDQICSQLF